MKSKKKMVKKNSQEKVSEIKTSKTPNKKIKYFLIAGLLGILILSGFFLISQQLKKENTFIEEAPKIDEILANVNGQEIYSSEAEEIINSLSSQGYQVSKKEALEQLIIMEILKQEARKAGYEISSSEAEEQMIIQLQFMGQDIEFLREELKKSNISYEDYIENYLELHSIQTYLKEKIEEKIIEPTPEEVKELYDFQKLQFGEEIPDFEEVEESIKLYLIEQQQEELMFNIIEELKENANIEYF